MNDNNTFEQLYEETKKSVLKYIAAHCYSISDIEDIYQETYLSLHGTLKKTDIQIENGEAFVKTVAKRTLSRYYSGVGKLKAGLSISLDSLREKGGDNEPADSFDVEQSICTDELFEEVYQLIGKLPIQTQRIIFLRYKLELSFDEISAETGMSASAASQRLNKALVQIRRLYNRRDNK